MIIYEQILVDFCKAEATKQTRLDVRVIVAQSKVGIYAYGMAISIDLPNSDYPIPRVSGAELLARALGLVPNWIPVDGEAPAPGRYLVMDDSFAVCSAIVLPDDFQVIGEDDEDGDQIFNENEVIVDCAPPITWGEIDDYEFACTSPFCTENAFFPTHYQPLPAPPSE